MNHYFIKLNTNQEETFSYHNDKYYEIYDVLWHVSTKKIHFCERQESDISTFSTLN